MKELNKKQLTLEQLVSMNFIRSQLNVIDDEFNREGLLDTPSRVVRSWDEIYSGYGQDPKDILTVFASDGYDQMVVLKDIELFSMCEHHMLPFYGKAHVGYLPSGKIVGISKLAYLVDIFARRLQIQERLTAQVTEALMKHLKPLGAICVIEATHMCMRMRGVSKQNSVMITSSIKGAFKEPGVKEEFMNLIK